MSTPTTPPRVVMISFTASSFLAIIAVTSIATLLDMAGFPTSRKGLVSSAEIVVPPGATVEIPLPGDNTISVRGTPQGVEIDAPLLAGLVAAFGPHTTLADGRARWPLKVGSWGPSQVTVDGTTLTLKLEVK